MEDHKYLELLEKIKEIKKQLTHYDFLFNESFYSDKFIKFIDEYDLYLNLKQSYYDKLVEISRFNQYQLSNGHQKVIKINNNLDHIKQLTVYHSSYFIGIKTFVIDFLEDSFEAYYSNMHNDYGSRLITLLDKDNEIVSKQYIIDYLKTLYIGEWKKNYKLPTDIIIYDIGNWEVSITFNNQIKPLTYKGFYYNTPHSLQRLEALFDNYVPPIEDLFKGGFNLDV